MRLFANAGITAGPGFLLADKSNAQGVIENIPLDLWRNAVDNNLHGVLRTIKATVPHQKTNGGGRIVRRQRHRPIRHPHQHPARLALTFGKTLQNICRVYSLTV